MADIVHELKVKAAEVGSNLTEICVEADVPRSTVERWKTKTPNSIIHLKALEEAIDKRRKALKD